MSSLSTYQHNALLDSLFGAGAPATLYFALMTGAPTIAGGGTEVTGGSYARKAVTNNSTNFPAAASGVKTLGVAQAFVTATADWGTVVAVAIYDALSGGNLIGFAAVTSQVVPSGVTVTVAAGATITLAAAA
jgi:hypothetical protein